MPDTVTVNVLVFARGVTRWAWWSVVASNIKMGALTLLILCNEKAKGGTLLELLVSPNNLGVKEQTMNFLRLLLAVAMMITALATAQAQVGKSAGLLDANLARETELLAVPNLNAALVKAIMDKRPFSSVT